MVENSLRKVLGKNKTRGYKIASRVGGESLGFENSKEPLVGVVKTV